MENKKNNSESNTEYSDMNFNIDNPDEDYTGMCSAYTYTPAILPKVKRIIAMGDIHGDYQLAKDMFKVAKLIDKNLKWIGGDTYVVQVGDQIDNCRPSFTSQKCSEKGTTANDEASDIKILKFFNRLDNEAREKGGRVISLLGNHEIMNVEGMQHYVSYKNIREFDNYIDPKTGEKLENGELGRKFAFTPGNEYAVMLGCSRTASIIIGSNVFVHAGILPALLEDLNIKSNKNMENINYMLRKWLLGKIDKSYVDKIIKSSETSMFWTRILGNIPPNVNNKHKDCEEYLKPVLKQLNVGSIIIGHTPQSFKHSKTINSTCNSSSGNDGIWRVDNGSAHAFDQFDTNFNVHGNKSKSRKPQVLEILNDTEFNVIM